MGKKRVLSRRARVARLLALKLLAVHGLTGWGVVFDRRVRRAGACWFQKRLISLSIHHVEHDEPAAVMDTILREIAHALCGPRHNHDELWQATALRVGADPDWRGSCKPPPGRWQAVCPACGQVYHRYKNPAKSDVPLRGKMWCCRKCGVERGRLVRREVGVRSPRGDAAGVAEEEPKDSGSP